MKQVIGFTNKYYTLWKVSDPYIYWKSDESTVERIDYIYIKNLSMDFDSAKSKMDGEYDIDLGYVALVVFLKHLKIRQMPMSFLMVSYMVKKSMKLLMYGN